MPSDRLGIKRANVRFENSSLQRALRGSDRRGVSRQMSTLANETVHVDRVDTPRR